MNYERNNLIIALYIGAKLRRYKGIQQVVFKNGDIFAVNKLNYHKNWKSIIKVIRYIKNNSDCYNLRIKDLLWSLESLDIRVIYSALLKYIKDGRQNIKFN